MQPGPGIMRVEFFGLARQRAGVSHLEVQAETLGQLLAQLSQQLPSLRECIAQDRLAPACSANLNGDRFVNDPQTRLRHDDCVLILSADAGG